MGSTDTPARICTKLVILVAASTEIPVVPTEADTPRWLNTDTGLPAEAVNMATAASNDVTIFFILLIKISLFGKGINFFLLTQIRIALFAPAIILPYYVRTGGKQVLCVARYGKVGSHTAEIIMCLHNRAGAVEIAAGNKPEHGQSVVETAYEELAAAQTWRKIFVEQQQIVAEVEVGFPRIGSREGTAAEMIDG